MADYCNLKGKTPFDFFPDDVVMEHCSDRGLWSKQDLLERFSKGHSQKVIYSIAMEQGNKELAQAVKEQYPELFVCCINPNL